MNPMISIIVPVYKVEEYICRCIGSLINQTYKDIEIILVDDGSPDNCPGICDKYSEDDCRVKVIHKANGGASDARNKGMEEASGEYILFVDSDDYIILNACELLVSEMEDRRPDIVVGNAKVLADGVYVKNIAHRICNSKTVFTGQEYLKEELKTNSMHMVVVLNLCRREFLIKNKLEFKYGLLHEDEQFTPRVFLKAEKVVTTNIFFYNYMTRKDSISNAMDKTKDAEHLIGTCKELEGIYNSVEDEELRALLLDNLVNKYLNIFQVARLYREEVSYLIDNDFLKGKSYTRRNKMRVLLFSVSKRLYYYVNNVSKKLKLNGILKIFLH